MRLSFLKEPFGCTVVIWAVTVMILQLSRSSLKSSPSRPMPDTAYTEAAASPTLAPGVTRWTGPSLRCPIPKPCKFAVSPSVTDRTTAGGGSGRATVYMKVGLAAPLARSQGEPVGRMARTERWTAVSPPLGFSIDERGPSNSMIWYVDVRTVIQIRLAQYTVHSLCRVSAAKPRMVWAMVEQFATPHRRT